MSVNGWTCTINIMNAGFGLIGNRAHNHFYQLYRTYGSSMANKLQRHYARTLPVGRMDSKVGLCLTITLLVHVLSQTKVLEARKATCTCKLKTKTQGIVSFSTYTSMCVSHMYIMRGPLYYVKNLPYSKHWHNAQIISPVYTPY